MEVALSPLEFARRARALYGAREAVVDGALRLTYEQFFDRCDRFSSALQALGVKAGDRVAYIAPNTHAQLESFYAVPQIGAVLVPINYRLSPEEFALHHQSLGRDRRLRSRGLPRVLDEIRAQLPGVRHFVALEGRPRTEDAAARQTGEWLDYEALVSGASPNFARAEIGERDLLTINYTSGTTSRPKGVMITHRNAYLNTVGTLLHLPMPMTRSVSVDAADVPRQRLDVRLDRDRRGRGARVPPQDRAGEDVRSGPRRGRVDALRGADGADRHRGRTGRGPREGSRRTCAW